MKGSAFVYKLIVVDNDLVNKKFYRYEDRVKMYKDAIEYRKTGKRVYVGEISPNCELYKNDDLTKPRLLYFDYRNAVLTYGLESNCSHIIQHMALLLHGKDDGYIMCNHIEDIINCIEEMNENLKYLKEAFEEYIKQGV